MSRTLTLKAFSLSGFSFAGGTATVPASAVTHVGVRLSDNVVVMTDGSVNVDRTVIWLATVTANATAITLVVEHDPLIQIELGELEGAVSINPDDLPPTLLTGAERLAVRQAGAWARTTAYDIAALAGVGPGNLPVSEYTTAAVAGSSTITLPAGIFNFAAEFSLYFDAAYQGANTYTYDALTSTVTLNAPIPAGVDTVHVLPRGGKGDKGDTGDAGAPGANGESATVGVAATITGAPGTSASVTNLGTPSAAFLQFTIPRGAAGFPGADATVAVGTTTTLPAGSSATVANAGTPSDVLLNFGIPKGAQGDQGNAATVTVGTTTTLPAGSSATVTNVGTSSAAVFDFGIPRGLDGAGAGDMVAANNLSELTDKAQARTNLGLGSAATAAATAFVARTNGTAVNPTITNYVETVSAPAAATTFTVNLANGTVHNLTTSGNATITLPAPVAGKSYVVAVTYGGNHTVTFAGGGTLRWAGGTAPTRTGVTNKTDLYSFVCLNGTHTLGADGGRNF